MAKKWKATRLTPSTIEIDAEVSAENPLQVLLVFDAHWDNPKCNRRQLKRHLDYAKDIGAAIVFGGDFFCAMQGKYDKRHSKADVLPEHQTGNYFDSLVRTAVEWLEPYRDNIACVGYGNHETAIIKRHETDLIDRLCYGLRIDAKGGYGGYVLGKLRHAGRIKRIATLKYFHGAGGGGPVTKGTIQANRRQCMYPDADVIATGHIHESWDLEYVAERISHKTGRIELREVLHIQCPTYKEEYRDGTRGWHVERGAPPKPTGGKMLEINLGRDGSGERSYSINTRVERLR